MPEDKGYLYEVRPKKTVFIKSLGKNVRVPKSFYLTKEDVKSIIGNAHIFRRFTVPTTRVERVHTGNIDRLHHKYYMTEEEYKEFLKRQAAEGSQSVREAIDYIYANDNTPEETPTVEEVKEETPVAESVTEEVSVDETPEEVENVEESNTDSEIDTAAEDQQKVESDDENREDSNSVEERSDDESVEADTVEDDDAEDSTEDKEGLEWSEEPIRNQNNTNQQNANRVKKKHRNR